MSTEGGLLSEAELGSIHDTWGLVAKDLKGNGAQFFIQYVISDQLFIFTLR
jgi:hypothetical protein